GNDRGWERRRYRRLRSKGQSHARGQDAAHARGLQPLRRHRRRRKTIGGGCGRKGHHRKRPVRGYARRRTFPQTSAGHTTRLSEGIDARSWRPIPEFTRNGQFGIAELILQAKLASSRAHPRKKLLVTA